MASFIAKNATVTFVGSSIASMCIKDVSFEVASSTDKFTCMGSDWESTLAAVKSWTASWETTLDDTVGIDLSNTVGVSALLTINTVDGLSYSGTAIITGASVSGPRETHATVSWSSEGTGAFTEV